MATNKSAELTPASFEGSNLPATIPDLEDDITLAPEKGAWVKPKYSSTTEGMDEEDTSHLRLRIGQPNTPEVASREAEVGDFVMTGFPAMKRVIVIPCMWGKMRAYGTGAGSDRTVYCTSGDGIEGTPVPDLVRDLAIKPSGVCATCKCAQWMPDTRKPNGKNRPPLCDTIFSYICYIPDLNVVADLRLKKTQMNAAKMFNDLGLSRGFGHYAVDLYCTVGSNDSRQVFATPQVKIVNGYPKDVLLMARVVTGIATPADLGDPNDAPSNGHGRGDVPSRGHGKDDVPGQYKVVEDDES